MKNRYFTQPLAQFAKPSALRRVARYERDAKHHSHQTLDKPDEFDGWVPDKWKRQLTGKGVSDFVAFEKALRRSK